MSDDQPERQLLLDLYKDLRVADVRDGMDWNLLHHSGSLPPDFRPLYRVRAFGIARTARYIPYQGTVPAITPDEYTRWSAWYYETICRYPWIDEILPDDFIVIDQSEVNTGLMGSNNGLSCKKNGANGLVSNGGVRDTDELILQQVPFWSRFISQSMVQGRLQYDAHNIPVIVGGVMIYPGDVIVADGDGIIAVPQEKAVEVARYAHRELENDKTGRRKLYESLGMELDESVK